MFGIGISKQFGKTESPEVSDSEVQEILQKLHQENEAIKKENEELKKENASIGNRLEAVSAVCEDLLAKVNALMQRH